MVSISVVSQSVRTYVRREETAEVLLAQFLAAPDLDSSRCVHVSVQPVFALMFPGYDLFLVLHVTQKSEGGL